MSHFEDNKYRFRKLSPTGHRLKTQSGTRIKTVKAIAIWLKMGQNVSKKMKFFQRNVTPIHRQKLLKCALLWNELDEVEKELKDRPPLKNIK
jgi:hypothetical protein